MTAAYSIKTKELEPNEPARNRCIASISSSIYAWVCVRLDSVLYSLHILYENVCCIPKLMENIYPYYYTYNLYSTNSRFHEEIYFRNYVQQ